jgi:multicomponent Na+:H+ antiporter subunit G
MSALGSFRDAAFVLLCLVSCVFAVAGTVGLFRFPDVYSRLQASSLAGTTAVFTSFLASLVISPSLAVGTRVGLVMLFFLLSNPTTTHIIARYAWRSGVEPWIPRSGE